MSYQFAPPKYITETSFGVVLVMKQLVEQSDGLVSALEPYAEKYRSTLKFTFFIKMASTDSLCSVFGIQSNDEMLLIEKPREMKTTRSHSNVPKSPMFRLEKVTPESVVQF